MVWPDPFVWTVETDGFFQLSPPSLDAKLKGAGAAANVESRAASNNSNATCAVPVLLARSWR